MIRKAVGMRWRRGSENRAVHQGREKSAALSSCILMEVGGYLGSIELSPRTV